MLSIGETDTATSDFLAFVEDNTSDPESDQTRTTIEHDGVAIKLGSVHSVKGKTVDAILMLETEVWRSSSHRTLDLVTVLPHAFGLEEKDFTSNPAHLSAVTNVFVAATRPREVLALAMRKQAARAELLRVVREHGWHVVDLTPS